MIGVSGVANRPAVDPDSGRDDRPSHPVVLDRVTKRFGAVTAVDELSLTIRQGEMLSMLGPSGCGKTTTLRMIAGLDQPTSGDLRINDRSMGATPPHKRNLGLVPQHYGLFPHLDVNGNVAFGLRMRKVRRAEIAERVARALDLVRLGSLGDRYPSQLSGGQQQRVALARAIVTEPTVLLLDEPLGALDRQLRTQMQVELKSLQERVGLTTVFVTHDQEEALTLSDRIAVMSDGRLLQLGGPKDVYERPANRFVADFLGTSNLMSGTVASARPGRVVVDTPAGPVACVPAVAPVVGSAVELTFRPESVALSSDEPDRPNRFRAWVLNVLYHGPTTTVRLDLGTERPVVAAVTTATSEAVAEPGHQVWCSWPPQLVHLLDQT